MASPAAIRQLIVWLELTDGMQKIADQVPQEVFTAGETAAILKVTEKTVYRLVARQRLEAVKALRHLRITRGSLEKLLSNGGGGH
jgi:excisionase family DNA binding protein